MPKRSALTRPKRHPGQATSTNPSRSAPYAGIENNRSTPRNPHNSAVVQLNSGRMYGVPTWKSKKKNHSAETGRVMAVKLNQTQITQETVQIQILTEFNPVFGCGFWAAMNGTPAEDLFWSSGHTCRSSPDPPSPAGVGKLKPVSKTESCVFVHSCVHSGGAISQVSPAEVCKK